MTKIPAGIRARLLDETVKFIRSARNVPGVRRIALIGSIITDRADPKDIDLLVTVADDIDLSRLAALARQLKGHLQSQNRGADIFLADERGRYLGRTCSWKRCEPGARASCDALHCGRQPYLHDDLQTVRLANDVVAAPPLEVWPHLVRRCAVPDDVEGFLAQVMEPHNNAMQRTAPGVTPLADFHPNVAPHGDAQAARRPARR